MTPRIHSLLLAFAAVLAAPVQAGINAGDLAARIAGAMPPATGVAPAIGDAGPPVLNSR